MTTADPFRSPEGTESAWTYTHVPRNHPWDQDAIHRYAYRIEQIVERHAPGPSRKGKTRAPNSPTG